MRPNTGCHPRRRQPQSKLLSAASGDVAARLATLIVEIVIRESQSTVVSRVVAGLMLPAKRPRTHPRAELPDDCGSALTEEKIYRLRDRNVIAPNWSYTDRIGGVHTSETVLLYCIILLALCILRLEHSFHLYSYAYDVIQIQHAPDIPFNCHINFLTLGKWEGNVMFHSLYRGRAPYKADCRRFFIWKHLRLNTEQKATSDGS